MLVVLRPEAEQELLEAQAWYESKVLGLGFEFARAADAAVASALRNPLGHLHLGLIQRFLNVASKYRVTV